MIFHNLQGIHRAVQIIVVPSISYFFFVADYFEVVIIVVKLIRIKVISYFIQTIKVIVIFIIIAITIDNLLVLTK